MRLHRRALLPADCLLDPWAPGCSPPPVVPSTYNPGLAPSQAPHGSPPPAPPPCPQVSSPPAPAPAPAPVPVNRGGRRDQGGGMPGYGAPPAGGGGGDGRHRQLVTSALIAAGVIAFVSLILLGVSVAVRRRQVRRRRQALLAPAAPAGAANVFGGGGDDDPEGGGVGGGGGVVHHIWYIRTVGLDEAAINSIAVTRYRAGAGLLGAADCSVCLGEFRDGELVRLLPKCGHAFHVPCIDTWLRAHVNCPLCRSDVLDPASGAGAETSSGGPSSSSTAPADPDANANDAGSQAAAASDASSDQEGEEDESDGRGASSTEEEEQQEQSSSSSSPEPLPPPQLFCPLPRNVRRAASMDAALVSTAADVAAALDRLPEADPEEEQHIGGRRKRGTGQRGGLSTDRPASVGVPRSFFSRHCRARSSVLPLGLD